MIKTIIKILLIIILLVLIAKSLNVATSDAIPTLVVATPSVEPTIKPVVESKPIKITDDGNYFIQDDIPEGRYDIKWISGNGTVSSFEDTIFCACLDEDNKLYKNVDLRNNMKLEIQGIDVEFIKVANLK